MQSCGDARVAAPPPAATSDGGIERRRVLKDSAYQSGDLITTESSLD
jgi:hypothetical protein